MFAGFITWRDGRAKLRQRAARSAPCRGPSCRACWARATRVPGTAVFLVSQSGFVPTALLRNLEHNHVCHEQHRDPAPRDPAHAAPGPRGARLGRGAHARRCTPCTRASASWRRRTSPRRCAARASAGLRIDDADCTYFVGWHLVRARAAARARRAQGAGVRLSATPQRAGGRILPHADQARRRARDGDRHLAGCARAHARLRRSSRFASRRGTAMPLYIVQFEDKPNMGELRDKLLKSHFEFLDRVKDRVLVPGSMREVPSDKPLGGLWIIEAKDEAEVRDIFKDDPFWTSGMRARRADQPLAEGVPRSEGAGLAAAALVRSANRERVARRAARALELERRKEERELVDALARELLGQRDSRRCRSRCAVSAAGARGIAARDSDSARPPSPTCPSRRARPRARPDTARASKPTPGALAANAALSVPHSEPQPVCTSTTSPARTSVRCRSSAPRKSASVIS